MRKPTKKELSGTNIQLTADGFIIWTESHHLESATKQETGHWVVDGSRFKSDGKIYLGAKKLYNHEVVYNPKDNSLQFIKHECKKKKKKR